MIRMRRLSIDIETRSDIDIKNGVYKYVDSPAFRILLIAYKFSDEDTVHVADLTEDTVTAFPYELFRALYDENILKTAYNANFEITCFDQYFKRETPNFEWLQHYATDFRHQWQCTSVLALYCGLPGFLAGVAKAMGLPEDKQKDAAGKRLINFFCKPTKEGAFREPDTDPEKWSRFKDYCGQDVVVESAIYEKLIRFGPGEEEHALWMRDQEINARGVGIDRQLVEAAIDCDRMLREENLEELQKLTGLENANSNTQFGDWLRARLNKEIPTVDKAARADLLADKSLPPDVRRALELKDLLSKTSVKKYEAIQSSACSDGRVHGMLQFYGAARTGRWAGRIVQVHNLPRNSIEDLDDARTLLKRRDFTALEMFYDNVPDVLSQLIRTAFVPAEGTRFVVADFSAIEARVIAWLAGEKWRQETFAAGGDIYCASASQMFHVPVVKHGINGHLRQKGKVAELALGYGGGPKALIAMGALDMGLTEEELPDIVTKWRQASPHIVQMWTDCEQAAKKAVMYHTSVSYKHGIRFIYESGILFIQLPNGRRLCYPKPKLQENRFGTGQALTFEGTGVSKAAVSCWVRQETYGGKLVENIVQATARDCLAYAMLHLPAKYMPVFHVHDEIVAECIDGTGSVEEMVDNMKQTPPWAEGLILNADGYEAAYYKKD